jgi:hypothetical protein
MIEHAQWEPSASSVEAALVNWLGQTNWAKLGSWGEENVCRREMRTALIAGAGPTIAAKDARIAQLEMLLRRWCLCPEITEIDGSDLEPESDQVWRDTRTALAGCQP